MTKRKKIILAAIVSPIAVVLIAMVIGFIVIFAMLSDLENNSDDARKIALKKFGMESVWVVTWGHGGSMLTTHQSRRPICYVLGEKDGKEILIIVPEYKADCDPYEVEWPFQKTFREIVADLNEYAGSTVCEESDYGEFIFYDHEYQFGAFEDDVGDLPVDFEFMMQYRDYLIFQSDQEIVILEVEYHF